MKDREFMKDNRPRALYQQIKSYILEKIASEMGLKPGEHVFHSIIIHKDGNCPVQFSERFVNPVIAPDYLNQDFTLVTPSRYLLGLAPLQETEHIIEAILPDEKLQKALHIKESEPCLSLYRRTWSFGKVATRSRLVYPGSRYLLGGRFQPIPSPPMHT